MKKSSILGCISVITLLVGCTQSNVEQASAKFNQLPAAVQQTARSRAPTAEITDVSKHTQQGHVVYRIEFRDANRYPPMEIAENGMIVKYEAGSAAMGRADSEVVTQQGSSVPEGPLSALPPGVQRAITEQAPKAQVMDIRRTEQNGRVVYEIEYAGHEPRPVLQVGEDGTILKKPGEPFKQDQPREQRK